MTPRFTVRTPDPASSGRWPLDRARSVVGAVDARLRDRARVVRSAILDLLVTRASRDRLHAYWTAPDDGANLPEQYLDRGSVRSGFLAEQVGRHADMDSRILEIGCNVGRNLQQLYRSGYRHLTGIEISGAALHLFRRAHPECAASTHLIQAPVEAVIGDFRDKVFDIVFTMAVLEHIHRDSEWIFPHMVRIARTIVTIEDEVTVSERHFPRNYGRIFSRLGARQVDYRRTVDGAPPSFRYRAFTTVS